MSRKLNSWRKFVNEQLGAGCRKRAFMSMAHAERAAALDQVKLYAYRCHRCGAYHLTTQPQLEPPTEQ